MSKEKQCVTFAYRPSYNSNKDTFFKELNKSLSNITRKYDNVIAVDILDILDQKKESKNYLSELCNTLLFSNIIKSSLGSSIDVMVTMGQENFHHTSFIKAGMMLSFSRAFFKRISAKTIEYWSYSKFSVEAFLHKRDQEIN